MGGHRLELWFDFSCPYAYLASQRAHSLGVTIDWRPMLLGGVFRGIGAGDGPMATLGLAKAAHNLKDMYRWAEIFGVPFAMPPGHPMRTVRALRTLLGLPHDQWPAAIHALYAAYWQRGEDITTDAVIGGALRAAGIADAAVDAALAGADSDAIKNELRARTDEAIALGIFGAPAFVLRRDGRPPLLVWGQDRMPWLEAILAGWDPDAEAPPGGPRPFAIATSSDGRVDVYVDVASPFAYLAITQLPALAARAKVRVVPILLGALFREIGQQDVPLFAMPPPKLRYVLGDIQRWARWWGVPFSQPTKFPQRTIAAQRLVVLAAQESTDAAIRMAHVLSRAMWGEQQNLEDEATLAALLAGAGFPTEWIARTQEPAIKAALAANTAEAKQRGVFGVPTYVVNDVTLVWGQDRLDFVARALAGV